MAPTPHPAKAILALRRITQRRVARALDVSHHYVGRCLNGHDKPSAKFKAGLAALLDMNVEELFHPDEPGSAMTTEDIRAAARRIATATAEAQGLPAEVTDEATLAAVASVIRAGAK